MLQGHHEPVQMAGPEAGWQILYDTRVERNQADRVALQRQKIGDRRRGSSCVARLVVAHGTKAHGAAQIDEQPGAEIRLVLEPLEIIAIAAGKQLPIEIAKIVAGGVLAIFGELD